MADAVLRVPNAFREIAQAKYNGKVESVLFQRPSTARELSTEN
jgi:hypothetical protein